MGAVCFLTFYKTRVKSNGSLKKNLFKTGFANSFSFSFFLFILEGREKGERITSCRSFNDPIDFHQLKRGPMISLKND